MAKNSNTTITGIKSSSLAMYEGVFAAILGLGIGILHSLEATVDIANETQSVLSGLAFGMATGIISILILPLVYFGIGWIIGYIHGFVFNVVAETSGGIVLRTNDSDK